MNRKRDDAQPRDSKVHSLFRRERDHARLVENGGVAAVEISVTDGSRGNISAAYRVLHGLAAGLQTDTHEAWMARMHIEDRPRVTHVIETALAGKAMGYEVEYRVRGASDGAIEWILERINIERDGAGMPSQIVGVGIDITVRKNREIALRSSEERLRTLADAVPQLIWTNDSEGIANYFNERWYQYTGLDYQRSYGLGWQAVVHPEDGPWATRQWEESLVAGQPLDTEYRLRDRDGVYRWFLGRNVPLKDDAGNIQGWFGTATEIDQLKRAEQSVRDSETRYRELSEDLARARDALLAADQQKDQFIATLAHELRNPLAPVRSAMQLISLIGSDDPQVLWALDVVNRQTNNMTRLIDDLMDVSRLTQNKLTLQMGVVNLANVLRDARDANRPAIEMKSLSFTMDLPSAPIELQGDHTRLAQVFTNLLDNATRYTESGGAIVLTARLNEELHEVEVSVRDSGIGIAAQHRERIFDLFSQVRNSRDRGKGGLGVGLSLVRELVQMHGGSVDVLSEGEGRGSEFLVHLPVLADPTHVVSDVADVAFDASELRGARVLVVDDNVDAADAFKVLLTREGSEVRAVYDGEAALRSAEEFAPDIVLMDIGLPKLTGHEVAERIRAAPWGARMLMVAISGWGSEEEKRKSYAAGIDRHLVKPVEPRKLMRVMVELLRDA